MSANPVAKDFDQREAVERARLHHALAADAVDDVETRARALIADANQRLDAAERRIERVVAAAERYASPGAAQDAHVASAAASASAAPR